MASIPQDPWGREYELLDYIGCVRCKGPDAEETLDDIVVSYLPDMAPKSASFQDKGQENYGEIGKGDILTITFTRPINVDKINGIDSVASIGEKIKEYQSDPQNVDPYYEVNDAASILKEFNFYTSDQATIVPIAWDSADVVGYVHIMKLNRVEFEFGEGMDTLVDNYKQEIENGSTVDDLIKSNFQFPFIKEVQYLNLKSDESTVITDNTNASGGEGDEATAQPCKKSGTPVKIRY